MVNRPQPAVDVLLHNVNGLHWYEAVDARTRDHRAWLQSVTRFTKEAPKGQGLKIWMANTSPEEQERLKIEGGIRGSAVHDVQRALVEGEVVKLRGYPREVAEHVLSVRRWYEDLLPQFVSAEEIVFNVEEGVAGTLDMRYVLPAATCETLKIPKEAIRDEIGGIHVVHDTKTSKGIFEEAHVQVNEYGYLRNSMGIDESVGLPVEWTAILRTNSRHKCGYEYVIEPLSEARHQVFRCLKQVVDHFEPKDGPVFPKPLPESVTLYGDDSHEKNGKHAGNGRR